MVDQPDLLTATEAGLILGIHPVTVTRWARADKLPFVLVPPHGLRMYERKVVEDLAARRPAHD